MFPQDRIQTIKPATADQPRRIVIMGPNMRPKTGKSTRSGSMPTSNMNTTISSQTTQLKTTYENIVNSITRNHIQEKYKKLLTSFRGLTSQEKLKVISPERVTKFRDRSHEVPKDIPGTSIFSVPEKKKADEKFQPANVIFPLVPHERPKSTSSVQPRSRHHRGSLPTAGHTRNEEEDQEQGADHFSSTTTFYSNLNKTLANLKKSSYEPAKETIDLGGGETLDKLYKTNTQFMDTDRSSIDSDVLFNFKAKAMKANLRYQSETTMEDSTIPKEGSLLKYFRAQKLRPNTALAARKNVVYLDQQLTIRERPQTTVAPTRKVSHNVTPRRQTKNSLFDTSFDQQTDTSLAKLRGRDSSAFVVSQRTRPSTSLAESRNDRLSISYTNSSRINGGKLVDASQLDLSKRASLSNQRGSIASSVQPQDVRHSSVPVIWERMSSVREDSSSRKKESTSGEITLSKRNSSRIVLSARSEDKRDSLIQNIAAIDRVITFEDFEKKAECKEVIGEDKVTEQQQEEQVEEDPEVAIQKLVTSMRNKMKTIQDAMLEDAKKEDELEGGDFAERFALAEIIESRGGVVQQPKVAKLFEKNEQQKQALTQEIEKVESQIKNLERENQEYIQTVKQGYEEALKTSPAFLTEAELNFLKEEFKKNNTSTFNVEKIDEILLRLKFFEKIEKPIRLGFYKSARYEHVDKGQYIIKDGEYGDDMYVIIRGCVDMRIKRGFKDGQVAEITVASLYDGNQFGDVSKVENMKKKGDLKKPVVHSLAQIKYELEREDQEKRDALNFKPPDRDRKPTQEFTVETEEGEDELPYDNPRKYASIYTAEDCDFLVINREKFKQILVSVLQRDIDDKIKALQLLKFFKVDSCVFLLIVQDEDREDLVPLANNLGNIQFQMGQRIINTGDFLDKLYIVAKGRCKAVYEIIEEDVLIVDRFRKKLRNFQFKEFNSLKDNAQIAESARKKAEIELKRTIPESVSTRTFDNEKYLDPENPNANKYRRHIVFKEMAPGDFFGKKPLLYVEDEKSYYEDEDNKSKLTIVADSPVIELYTLDKKSLIYLPDRIKNILLNGLAEVKDYDEVDIEKGIEEHKSWHKFKYDLISKTLTKPEIPNLQKPRDLYKAY